MRSSPLLRLPMIPPLVVLFFCCTLYFNIFGVEQWTMSCICSEAGFAKRHIWVRFSKSSGEPRVRERHQPRAARLRSRPEPRRARHRGARYAGRWSRWTVVSWHRWPAVWRATVVVVIIVRGITSRRRSSVAQDRARIQRRRRIWRLRRRQRGV